MLVFVAACAGVAARGDTPATPPSALPDPTSAPESAPQTAPAARPLLRRPADAKGTPAGVPAVGSSAWVRTTAALTGVVGLIVLLTWGYRTVMGAAPTWRTRPRHPGLIEVLSRTPLSPRQSLCLVRVGRRLVLLGVTPDNVRPLHVIRDPEEAAGLLGEAARARPDSSSAAFAQTLAREAQTYTELDKPPLPADATEDLAAARDRVLGALARLRAKGVGA